MDKELQKMILNSLKKRGFTELQKTIIHDVSKSKWDNQAPIPSEEIIIHQAKMLRDEGKINFMEHPQGIYYEMTKKGQKTFDSWYKKAWHWFLYDKNNLYTILSVLISLVAIVVSVIALNK